MAAGALPPWDEPYWDDFLQANPLTLNDEGAFMAYLEGANAPEVTDMASLEAAYVHWRSLTDPGAA